MKLKEKGWIWKLTGPFASNNFTYFRGTIYHPKGRIPSNGIILHESVHEEQQKKYTWLLWHFLYLLCLPVLWNPWRKKWEAEAYKRGQKLTDEQIEVILKRAMYGWLL